MDKEIKGHKLQKFNDNTSGETGHQDENNTDAKRTITAIPETLSLFWSLKVGPTQRPKFRPKPTTDEFTTKEDCEKFFRRLRLKAFFHNQNHQNDGPANDPAATSDDRERDEPTSTPDDNQIFERLKPKQSTWIPPSGQFSSLDHYIHRCRTEINRLDLSKQVTVGNLSKEERDALTSLRNRTDIVIKPANKGGAVVVWDRNLYLEEATKQLSDTHFYQQIDGDIKGDYLCRNASHNHGRFASWSEKSHRRSSQNFKILHAA